jgi:hypothetical protein
MKKTLWMSLALLALISTGCGRRRRRAKPEPAPVVVAEPAPVAAAPAVQAIPDDPCTHQARAHHWIFYPDEPLYFCDTHRHHWIPNGAGGWAHIHEYDQGRPNYAAPILSNQGEYEIYQRYEEHSVEFPPGTRR